MREAPDGGLRAILREELPGYFHWQWAEGLPGVPDVNYCATSCEGWVECKATRSMVVKFQPLQPGWIARRTRAGGRVWVAVRRWKVAGGGVDELWMVPGRLVMELQREGLEAVRLESGVWSGGPRHWRWDEVHRLLTM